MKKAFLFCVLITTILITSGFVHNSYFNQSDDFPPIQKFLDKVKGEKFVTSGVYDKDKMVSQIITKNTFTEITQKNKINKTIFSNINWQSFYNVNFYSVRETKKIIKCRFEFRDYITFTGYNDKDEVLYSGKEKIFDCYLYAKDEKDVLKIIEDWEKSRK
jgi:hypothetical protein